MSIAIQALVGACAVLGPLLALADEAQQETVVVTGTRQERKLRESTTPIDVVTAETLRNTGQTNLLDALKAVLPSLNAPAVGYDVGALARTFQLRGLSPGQTLVLVNGKRRHLSASLYADEDPAQGSNGVDLDFIPLTAIDHVEVLRDGAAAQYGSDAIAGVVNVILKRGATGGSAAVGGGAYTDGGGLTGQAAGDFGFTLGDKGFGRVSIDAHGHDFSNRSGDGGGPLRPQVQGDPRSAVLSVALNLEKQVAADLSLYGFGTLGARHALAYENYRSPSFIADNLTPGIAALYPDGFSPEEASIERDLSLTAGAKGKGPAQWNYDLSVTYGRNQVTLHNIHSANADLLADTGSTPTSFRVGGFAASELTTDADINRSFDLGSVLAGPLNVAAGLEQRHETFSLSAGDAASTYGSGSIAFPGFLPSDASRSARNSVAAYVDVGARVTSSWQLDVAGRVEHDQGVGDTQTGKVSTRYEFTPALAIRGTVSNGFHAPTLVQEHYSATNVTTGGAYIQIPLGTPGAQLLGAGDLKPEKSKNASLGLTAAPAPGWNVTVDAYLIDLDDRIVDSGGIGGPLAASAIAANGAVVPADAADNALAQFFTNGVDTRTRGVDFHADTRSDYASLGSVRWGFDYGYNRTAIRRIHDAPQALAAADIPLIDAIQVSNLTTATPRYKATLSGTWSQGPWEVTLRETRYGSSTQAQWGVDYAAIYYNTVRPAFITDLDVGFYARDNLRIDVGANNLFGTYPNKTDPRARLSFDQYSHVSPYGINGTNVFARLTSTF